MHFTLNIAEEEGERVEVVEGPETKFRILCVREGDAAGLPHEVRSTVRVHEVTVRRQRWTKRWTCFAKQQLG